MIDILNLTFPELERFIVEDLGQPKMTAANKDFFEALSMLEHPAVPAVCSRLWLTCCPCDTCTARLLSVCPLSAGPVFCPETSVFSVNS